MTEKINTREVQAQRAFECLHVAHHLGGWITTSIMGWWFWPEAANRKKYAERLMADMIERSFLLKRVLPNRFTAGVVTLAGARFANESCWDYELKGPTKRANIRPGTDWGRSRDGEWAPPISWQHQLRAGKFLAWFSAKCRNGVSLVLFDTQIQRANTTMLKRPDGLVVMSSTTDKSKSIVLWVEVESSRKTGDELTKLIDAFEDVQKGHAPQIFYIDEEGKHAIQTNRNALVVPAKFNDKAFERNVQKRLLRRVGGFSLTLCREQGDTFLLESKRYIEVW